MVLLCCINYKRLVLTFKVRYLHQRATKQNFSVVPFTKLYEEVPMDTGMAF